MKVLFSSEQTAAPISGLITVMTAAQLLDARMLIPGAFELNAPLHRATPDPRMVLAVPSPDVRPSPSNASPSHVVSAPARPTTRLGKAAAILGDLALITGIIYGVAVVPALAVWGVGAAVAFVLDTLGRH